MTNNKKSFIIHIDSLSVLDEMTDDQAGKLFKAIHNYQKGSETELDVAIKIAFVPFRNQFIRDNESYYKFVKTQSEKGKLSAESRKKNQIQPKSTAVDSVNRTQPKATESTYSVNDSVNVKDKEKEEYSFFLAIHQSYPGLKKHTNTELANFKKVTKDWRVVLPLLLPALQAQIASRKGKDWNPEWKTFGNWITGRCWEEIHSSVSSDVEMSEVPGISAKEWDKMSSLDKCRALGVPYV